MTPVVVPDLGELIQRVRVVAWLHSIGDRVERDAPLVEIMTDKIDAVVSAPAYGVLRSISVPADEWTEVGAVIGMIESTG